VRSHDAEAFARALARVVEDAELRLALGVRGRRFVERIYAKERLIGDVMKLYEELLHEKTSGAQEVSPPAVALRAIETTSLKED
jgi:hypothetical protein